MNMVAASRYPFNDSTWFAKLFIGALVLLIPIVGVIIWVGYIVEVIRRVSAGNDRQLPEWSNIGDYLRQGLVASVAYLAYFVPMWSFFGCAIYIVAIGQRDLIQGNFAAAQPIALGGNLIVLLLLLGLTVVSIPVWLFYSTALVRYAATDRVGAFLEVGETASLIIAHPTSVISAFLLAWGGYVLGATASYLCFWTICLPLFFLVFTFLFVGHTLGQLAAKYGLFYDTPSTDLEELI